MRKIALLTIILAVIISTSTFAQTWQLKVEESFSLSRDIAFTSTPNGYLYHKTNDNSFFTLDELGTMATKQNSLIPAGNPFSYIAQIELNSSGYVASIFPSELIQFDFNGNEIWSFDPSTWQTSNTMRIKKHLAFLKDGNNYAFAAEDAIYLIDENTGIVNNQLPFGVGHACAAIIKKANNYLVLAENLATNDFKLLELDNAGNILASPSVGMTAYDLIKDGNGFVVVGEKNGLITIQRYDSNLAQDWEHSFTTGIGHSVVRQHGNYIISASNGDDGILLSTNAAGNIIFNNTYPNIINNLSRTELLNANQGEGFVLATTTHILKTDAQGNIDEAEKTLFTNGAAVININNIQTVINPDGAFFWDFQDSYYRTPKDSATSTIFASGLWMGGFDLGGNLSVAAQTYSSSGFDYQPGYIGSNNDDMRKVWRLSKKHIKQVRRDFETDNIIDEPVPHDILTYPAANNPNALSPEGQSIQISVDYLPFFDRNQDGIYNVYDGDYPIIKGDMQLVWFMNDATLHTQSFGNPLDFDIVGILYGYECGGDGLVDNTLFFSLKGINKSMEPLDSVYVGMWTDFDLGCSLDDYVGSIPSLNTHFVYNANAIDGQGGCNEIPSFGVDVPIQSVTYLNQSLNYFRHYSNGGGGSSAIAEPSSPIEYYYLLSGRNIDGTSVINNGVPVNHSYPGNPSNLNEWSCVSDNITPNDFRTLATSAIPTIPINGEFVLEMAYITHNNIALPAPDVTPVGQRITQIQNHYDNDILEWDVYLGANKDLTIGQPTTITAVIEGGNTNSTYTYLWSTGETTASITATAPITYSVTVTNTTTGCSKTDAVQVDFPTSTDAIEKIEQISIFPNPVHDVVTIHSLQPVNEFLQLQVFDVTGKMVKLTQLDNSTTQQITVEDLTAGLYFFEISDDLGKTISRQKMIILD